MTGGNPREAFETALLRELARASVAVRDVVSADALQRLEALDREVSRWSAKMDLIGFRTPQERIRRYFAEPLAALAHVPESGAALDVGSGGGSPALPLAVARPKLRWTLMESRRKKSLGVSEIARIVGLENVRVVCERFPGGEVAAVDLVTIRGVRMTGALLRAILAVLRPKGRLLWFTGTESFAALQAELDSRWEGDVSGPHRLVAGSAASLVVARRR